VSIVKQCNQPSSMEQCLLDFERWFDKRLGRTVLATEQALIDAALDDSFGYYLLQLSVSRSLRLFDRCRVQRCYRCHPLVDVNGQDLVCHFDQLPLATESVDIAILHHVQGLVTDPHRLLREMQRIVVPHGRLLIVDFNPWSALGIYWRWRQRFSNTTAFYQLLSARRVIDWLSVLGFRIDNVSYGCHFSFGSKKSNDKKYSAGATVQRLPMQHLPTGGCYVITAVKEVATLTPTKFRWSIADKRFPGVATASSSVRGREQVNR
jgi:SAM-dependent methyltransferase